uniref:hypothetical protein n=1 Tax=Amycolatopsis sp. CA-096443 TaxID=3239919 RepID=UPI003F49A7C3
MTRRTGPVPAPGNPHVPPLACAEELVRHPGLPPGADPLPALPAGPHCPEWTFRPSVLAVLLDVLDGRGHSGPRTGYRSDPRTRTVRLLPPTGPTAATSYISDDLPFCPPPPTVARVLDRDGWIPADRQPAAAGWTEDACLAVLATPDRHDVEEPYVRAAPNVERLPPEELVTVAAMWTVPARAASLIVPAGLLALYETETRAPSAACDGDLEWLPDCLHCGTPLIDNGSVPGMVYPWPDLGPSDSPWCPARPHTDRPRPHVADWRPVRL